MSTGLVTATTVAGSAHTPGATADCSGVHIKGANYDRYKANRWSVTIAGQTQEGTFGSSLDKTFPVPQDGATTDWSAVIQAYDGSYKGTYGGKVGPCGTQPPVKDASASISITPATCTTPEQLVLNQAVNAAWNTPTRTTGPGSFSVSAIGNAGPPQHLFPSGPGVSSDGKTITFTGELKDKDTSKNCWAKDAAASVTVSPGTCKAPGSASVTGLQYATLVGTLDQSVGTHTATFQSKNEHLFPNGSDTLQVSYTVPGKDTSKSCNPPTKVRGGYKKLDKCGYNNFIKVKKVKGLHYVVRGKVIREGVWLKFKAKTVKVKVVADSSRYKVAGKNLFVVRFPNQHSCHTPPSDTPHTGMPRLMA